MIWADVKEVFYAVGATAGVIALLRPAIESKFQRDQERFAAIRKLFDELALVSLAGRIDGQRQVADKEFEPFRALVYDRRHNVEGLRFSGPVAKHFLREVDSIVDAYEKLRELIQVDEWEPSPVNGETLWVFNKQANAFRRGDEGAGGYAMHLQRAADRADDLRRAFQRLQIVGELHFYEVPIARWLLNHRFKANGLTPQ